MRFRCLLTGSVAIFALLFGIPSAKAASGPGRTFWRLPGSGSKSALTIHRAPRPSLGFAGSGAITDPTGDAQRLFGDPEGSLFDITAFSAQTCEENVIFRISFAQQVDSGSSDTSGPIGIIVLDLDQNPGTGSIGGNIYDEFYAPAFYTTSGIGNPDAAVDFDLHNHAVPKASVSTGGPTTALVPTYPDANTVQIIIPLTLLNNDDGIFNAATIIGSIPQPEDFAPNGAFLTSVSSCGTLTASAPLAPTVVPMLDIRALAILALALGAAGAMALRFRT